VLLDVAVSDAGWVAVGYRDLGSPEPLALYSPDGTSSTVASITSKLEGGLRSCVTAVGSGFVAPGMPGALWVSSDGHGTPMRNQGSRELSGREVSTLHFPDIRDRAEWDDASIVSRSSVVA